MGGQKRGNGDLVTGLILRNLHGWTSLLGGVSMDEMGVLCCGSHHYVLLLFAAGVLVQQMYNHLFGFRLLFVTTSVQRFLLLLSELSTVVRSLIDA
jgi:hypothetical protein